MFLSHQWPQIWFRPSERLWKVAPSSPPPYTCLNIRCDRNSDQKASALVQNFVVCSCKTARFRFATSRNTLEVRAELPLYQSHIRCDRCTECVQSNVQALRSVLY